MTCPTRCEATCGGWVIDDTGDVVGFAIVLRRGMRAAEILWAAVAADRRGAGLGTRLVNHVLDELSTDGLQIVEVKRLAAGQSGGDPRRCTHSDALARSPSPAEPILQRDTCRPP